MLTGNLTVILYNVMQDRFSSSVSTQASDILSGEIKWHTAVWVTN